MTYLIVIIVVRLFSVIIVAEVEILERRCDCILQVGVALNLHGRRGRGTVNGGLGRDDRVIVGVLEVLHFFAVLRGDDGLLGFLHSASLFTGDDNASC